MADGHRPRWAHSRAPGLDPWCEHDACGVGFVARASGERSADVTRLALQALAREVRRGDGSTVLGWRDVPVDPDSLGAGARATMPAIRQVVLAAPADGGRRDEAAWERAMYLARRTIERRVAEVEPGLEPFFACSL